MKVLGRPNNRPTLINNTTRKQQPPARSQNSISVDHEGLLFVVGAVVAAPLHDRRPSPTNDRYSVSSHFLNQPAWAVHLVRRRYGRIECGGSALRGLDSFQSSLGVGGDLVDDHA